MLPPAHSTSAHSNSPARRRRSRVHGPDAGLKLEVRDAVSVALSISWRSDSDETKSARIAILDETCEMGVFARHCGAGRLREDGVADGKVFARPEVQAKVEIPNQQALIYHSGGLECLVIDTAFLGEGTYFAWVVPLPAEPKEAAGFRKAFFPPCNRRFNRRCVFQESTGANPGSPAHESPSNVSRSR